MPRLFQEALRFGPTEEGGHAHAEGEGLPVVLGRGSDSDRGSSKRFGPARGFEALSATRSKERLEGNQTLRDTERLALRAPERRKRSKEEDRRQLV